MKNSFRGVVFLVFIIVEQLSNKPTPKRKIVKYLSLCYDEITN